MFEIKNLSADIDGKTILKGIDLKVNPGEVHAIMGPNGSGKSTMAGVISGNEDYNITAGKILLEGSDLHGLLPEERAGEGVFLAFQYPVAISGVNNMVFLQASLNSIRKYKGLEPLDAFDCIELIKNKMKLLHMNPELLQRGLNDGFSGGEKKRNEILQMLLLEPKLAILDETDSGLDIDALKTVAEGVNAMRDEKRSFIVVTHYQRLLDYIIPDVVHILKDGKIVLTGDYTLAQRLEKEGYGWLK
ncbi:MAG: Fe-S cluster assembly ATPase SufC [Legionellales bacterium]|nr:Fe-S cluster assembly ATPase SufC [Legionellales bacterium]OUX65834.1 MAG: Fe-S cluster assembly ATPase SufC [Gammaproteobacteria bacterium TMED281]